MKRSIGVTAAAVVTFLGALLTLAIATVMILGAAVAPPPVNETQIVRVMMYAMTAFLAVLAGWGIATGIGLLRLQNWSRISIIIFSVLLLISALPAIPLMLLMPMPVPTSAPSHMVTYLKIFLSLFYGTLAAVGVWWLVLFTRNKVRSQFQRNAETVQMEEAGTTATSAGAPRRPLSITVIAWFFIVGAALVVIMMMFRPPAILFGMLLTGWSATGWYMAVGMVQAVIGVGLLKVNATARVAAVAYLIFGLFNGLSFWILPGHDARLAEMLQSSPFPLTMPQVEMRAPMMFGMVAGMVSSFAFTAVAVWFLVKHKAAFQAARTVEGV